MITGIICGAVVLVLCILLHIENKKNQELLVVLENMREIIIELDARVHDLEKQDFSQGYDRYNRRAHEENKGAGRGSKEIQARTYWDRRDKRNNNENKMTIVLGIILIGFLGYHIKKTRYYKGAIEELLVYIDEEEI